MADCACPQVFWGRFATFSVSANCRAKPYSPLPRQGAFCIVSSIMQFTRVEISHSWAEWATCTRQGGFSVRGVTNDSLLCAVRSLVEDTIPAGIDAGRFFNAIQDIYKRHGAQISKWRATRIYRTFFFKFNLEKKRLQMLKSASIAPYWRFMSVSDAHANTIERFFHGKIFLYSSPVWELLYPPVSPYGRAHVESISERGFNRGNHMLSSGDVIYKDVRISTGLVSIPGVLCNGKKIWFDPKFVGPSNEELLL